MARSSRRFAATLIIAVVLSAFAPPSAFAAKTSQPGLYVPAAVLATGDGRVLWQHNGNKPRRVASCIKMLNALVVRDSANLDDVITISQKAASVDDGVIGLAAGQKITVRDLLGVMLVHSANGAAEALAIGIAGSEKKYVAMMTAKAKAIGCKHTRPADPHGLSPNGYSTASDLSLIASKLLDDPVLKSVVQQTSAHVTRGGTSASYSTTDRMLYSYRGIEGIKTGYTDPAGYCFVGAAKRNGIELIGVVLGADVSGDRFTQMTRLLNWGFTHSCERELVSREQTMGVVEVADGFAASVPVHPAKPLALTVLDSGGALTTQVSLPPSVRAPIAAGQPLGAVQITRGSTVVASVPLVADRAVGAQVHSPTQVVSSAAKGSAQPSLWRRIANLWAGLGHILGI